MTDDPKTTADLAAIKRGWSEMTEADKAAQRESFVRGQLGFGSDRDEAADRAAFDAAFYAGESAKAAAPEPALMTVATAISAAKRLGLRTMIVVQEMPDGRWGLTSCGRTRADCDRALVIAKWLLSAAEDATAAEEDDDA